MEPLTQTVALKFQAKLKKYGNSNIIVVPPHIAALLPKTETFNVAFVKDEDGWSEILSHNPVEVSA